MTTLEQSPARDCTCTGHCWGKEGLAPGWRCVLEKQQSADNSRLLRLAACERACAGLDDAELANLPAMLAEKASRKKWQDSAIELQGKLEAIQELCNQSGKHVHVDDVLEIIAPLRGVKGTT